MKGQQLPSVILEFGIDAQESLAVEITEAEGELGLGAVHLAQIQEGGQGVDLLPLIGYSSKIVGREPRSASGGRSERGDAAIGTGGQARVAGRNLGMETDTKR